MWNEQYLIEYRFNIQEEAGENMTLNVNDSDKDKLDMFELAWKKNHV